MPDQSSAATEHAILQEITRPLQALPDDPLAVIDADFPMALRGYDRVAVDEYVQRTRQLVAELQATRSPEAAVRRALERVGGEITGILQRAHETAEQITAQSRSEAEDRLEQARQEASQIISAAEQRVRDLDADTDRIWLERQRIVGDAEELAAQLQSLAKEALDRFPADAGAGAAPDASVPAAAAGTAAPPPAVPFAAGGDEDDLFDEEPEQPAAGEYGDVDETLPFHPIGSPHPAEDETDETESAPTGEQAGPDEEDPGPDGPDAGQPGPGGEPASGDGPTAAGGPAAGDPAAPERAEPPQPQSPGGRGSFTADDTTAVIPPASQAASRRLSQ